MSLTNFPSTFPRTSFIMTPIRGPAADIPRSLTKSIRDCTTSSTSRSTSSRRIARSPSALTASSTPASGCAERNFSISGIASFPNAFSDIMRKIPSKSIRSASTATPSRASSVRVSVSVLAINFGVTAPPRQHDFTNFSNKSDEDAAIFLASSSFNPYSRLYRSFFCSIVSGRDLNIRSMRSSSTDTGGTSVSGYIRAAPGSGLIYAVFPSGIALLVSSGTPLIASSARFKTASNALSTRSISSLAIRTTQSSSDALKASLTRRTSSALIPYAGSSSVCIMPTPYRLA